MRYVYLHPLFDERKCAHRFSYELSRGFEKLGLSLERFDYRGTGEAAGCFSEVTVDSLRADVAARVCGDRVCLVGLRFGASLALDHCVRSGGPAEALVLIEPIVNGAEYAAYLRRKQHLKDLMTGSRDHDQPGYENIEGYKAGRRLMGGIEAFDLLTLAAGCNLNGPVHIVQLSRHARVRDPLAALREVLETRAKHVTLSVVDAPPVWERLPLDTYDQLVRTVVDWCSEQARVLRQR